MPAPPVFLIGGGGDHPARAETYGRFLQAATRDTGRRLVLITAAEAPDEAADTFVATRAIFLALGAAEADIISLPLSPATPLGADRLAALAPTGVFVCGGATPLYQEALCRDRAWLAPLQAAGIPYGGVSAGAAVAATTAIVGGWQARHGDRVRAILFQGAGEDRDLLDVRSGLGLVPFTVEIHASQWGTLTRLLHALDLGLIPEGWAIDEATLLQVDAAGLQVHGAGQVYHARRDPQGGAHLTIHRAPERIAWPS
jgi:cyanophycinase